MFFPGRRLLLPLLLVALTSPSIPAPRTPLPRTILWAWERPEDLGFLPAEVGVAFLANTITVSRGAVSENWRAHPAKIPTRVPRIAVVRVETADESLAPEARLRIVKSIARAAAAAELAGVQIDFDARRSQRVWYRELLQELRHRLPARKSLSITALASWCEGDDWISGLPIDEAVPMIFRLGPERETFRQMLAAGRRFREPLCRTSVGISTDEIIATPRDTRVYWFSPVPWTAELCRRTGVLP